MKSRRKRPLQRHDSGIWFRLRNNVGIHVIVRLQARPTCGMGVDVSDFVSLDPHRHYLADQPAEWMRILAPQRAQSAFHHGKAFRQSLLLALLTHPIIA